MQILLDLCQAVIMQTYNIPTYSNIFIDERINKVILINSDSHFTEIQLYFRAGLIVSLLSAD